MQGAAPALTATPRPVELGGASTRGGSPGELVHRELRLLGGAVGGGRAVELAGGRAGRPLLRVHLGAEVRQDAPQRAEVVPAWRQVLDVRVVLPGLDLEAAAHDAAQPALHPDRVAHVGPPVRPVLDQTDGVAGPRGGDAQVPAAQEGLSGLLAGRHGHPPAGGGLGRGYGLERQHGSLLPRAGRGAGPPPDPPPAGAGGLSAEWAAGAADQVRVTKGRDSGRVVRRRRCVSRTVATPTSGRSVTTWSVGE